MKRFISGAVCPQCSGKDTLFFKTETDNNNTKKTDESKVFCHACDYQAEREQAQSSTNNPDSKPVTWH